MTLLKRKSKILAVVTKEQAQAWLDEQGTREDDAKRAVALAEVKDDFSKYLRLAAEGEIVITRHGRLRAC